MLSKTNQKRIDLEICTYEGYRICITDKTGEELLFFSRQKKAGDKNSIFVLSKMREKTLNRDINDLAQNIISAISYAFIVQYAYLVPYQKKKEDRKDVIITLIDQ